MSEGRLKNRLRLWRLKQGYTLEEVADLSGFSVSMLSRVERGERCLRSSSKVRLARALDVAVADLFDVEPVPDEAA